MDEVVMALVTNQRRFKSLDVVYCAPGRTEVAEYWASEYWPAGEF